MHKVTLLRKRRAPKATKTEVARPSPGARKGKHPEGGWARRILARSRAPEKVKQYLPEDLYLKAGTLGETRSE